MSQTPLFVGPLERHLRLDIRAMETAVIDIDSLGELERYEQRVHQPMEVLTLRRAEATWDTRTVPGGNQVSLVVPYEGNSRLFEFLPESAKGLLGADRLMAEVSGASQSWHVGESMPPKVVKFTKIFKAPTQEEVRGWGVDQVDLMEAVLSRQATEVAAHTDDLGRRRSQAIEARRNVLNAQNGLGDMGRGI